MIWTNAIAIILASAAGGPSITPDFPPHPRLLLSQDGVAQVRKRIETCDWARQDWQAIKKRADAALRRKVELPPRGSNWYHWYACPTHGVRLKTGKRIGPWQWEHICSVDNAVLKGDPSDPAHDYDGCAINSIHGEWSKSVRDLGLAYQITKDRRYASKAREVILAYAEIYHKYPLHTIRGKAEIGGGRIGSQSLDESVWMIAVCQGADLIWDTLTDEDRSTIANKLLLPSVREVILPHKLGIHNIQCWKNSAVGLTGFLLGDQELIHEAIDNPDRGYREQMKKGVLPDGDWWEGAWGYHFYTMSALWPLTEAARNCGIDLYGRQWKSMFDAPIKFAMPNLRLPMFSDSGETDIVASRGIYELGYARYHDPDYARVLSDHERSSDYALLYGVPDLPAGQQEGHKSANYPRAGYTVLTRGRGADATWLCMKNGPYGSGHGHPDKLSFVLYWRGQVIDIDPGTVQYGLPVQDGWFKTSIAHNTLVVDEANQKPVDGRCIEFGSSGDVDYVVADAGSIYEGVRFVRTAALLRDGLVLIIDQVKCGKDRLLDIACHQLGAWVDMPSGTPWAPPDKPGYRYLTSATIRPAAASQVLTTRLSGRRRAAITVCPVGSAELITAEGITSTSQTRVPVAIVRRSGSASTVIWAIALDGRPARVEQLPADAGSSDGLQPVAVRVAAADGKVWNVIANPDGLKAEVALPDGSTCSADSVFSVR